MKMPSIRQQFTRFFSGRPATEPATATNSNPTQSLTPSSRTNGTHSRSMRHAYPGTRHSGTRQIESRQGGQRHSAASMMLQTETQRPSTIRSAPHHHGKGPLHHALRDIFTALDLSAKNNTEAMQAYSVVKQLQQTTTQDLASIQARLCAFRDVLCEKPEEIITTLPAEEMLPEECPLTFEPIGVPLLMSYTADGRQVRNIYSLPTALVSWIRTGCDPTNNCPVAMDELHIIIGADAEKTVQTEPTQIESKASSYIHYTV